MPKVGKTEFPYTKAGMQEAKAWAAMTGEKMQTGKKYQFGGSLKELRKNITQTPEGRFAADILFQSPEGRFYSQAGTSRDMQLAVDNNLVPILLFLAY